jgi:hypothetical protein
LKVALEPVGFIYRYAANGDMFLDGPDAKARDALHLIFAGEKVREEYLVVSLEHEDAQVRIYQAVRLRAEQRQRIHWPAG